MKNFSIIAAIDQNMGISRSGDVPWYLPEDRHYFAKLTQDTETPGLKNALIWDEEGWNLLPSSAQPLPNRINVVLSENDDLDLPADVLQFINLEDALTALSTSKLVENVYVLGSVKLYEEAILHPNLERIFLTRIEEDFDCDAFFPDQIPEEFEVVSSTEILEDEGIEFSFVVLEKSGEESNGLEISLDDLDSEG